MRPQTCFVICGVMSTRPPASSLSSTSRKRRKTSTEQFVTSATSKTISAPISSSIANEVLKAEKNLADELDELSFESPVTNTYNPLSYGWDAHKWYVEKFGNSERDVLLVGMNPGPWGMCQTSVPFGEVNTVKNWMKMPESIEIGRPHNEHPKRPILGLECARSEVSGRRLWQEFAAEYYETPERFFSSFYIHNYCPLMFIETTGRNRALNVLKASERKVVEELCDVALREVILAMKPKLVCGVGGYAFQRITKVVAENELVVKTGSVLHPSPASPAANRGWVGKFREQLQKHCSAANISHIL